MFGLHFFLTQEVSKILGVSGVVRLPLCFLVSQQLGAPNFGGDSWGVLVTRGIHQGIGTTWLEC